MKTMIFPALASSLIAMNAAFADTNAKSSLWVCATPQNTVLDAAGYTALTWVKVNGMGELGETGTSTNILTYDEWDTDVVDKAKGMSNAGDPTVECRSIIADPGQLILKAAALTPNKYAFAVRRNDAADENDKPTTIYHRGLVTGPTHPNGRNEDFQLDVYTLGLVQREITVAPVVVP